MRQAPCIGIVGSGVSGIAAAYFAKKLGYDVEILEENSTIGGRVGCEMLGERKIEFGGKNIGRRYPLFREFVKELGDFEYEFFGINTSTVVDGKLRTINSENKVRTLMNVVGLTGVRDFMRLSRLVSAVKKDDANGYLGGEYFARLSQKYDAWPVSFYFGKRFNKRFLRPITVRMNGAEPNDYYLGNLGSNLKMILDKYDQLKEGIYSVLNVFAKQITVRTNCKVSGVVTRGRNVIGVEVEHNGVPKRFYYDAVVLGTPAAAAKEILNSAIPEVSIPLGQIQYNPVGVAVVKYAEPVFDKDVRALVFDDKYELSNAGAYGISDLDIVRYTFSGARATQQFGGHVDPMTMVELGEKYLGKFLPVTAAGREAYVTRYFTNGLCAYAPFHHALMKTIQVRLSAYSGLFLAGDYIRGAAIEACFRSAKEMSISMAQMFQANTRVQRSA